MTSPSDGGWPDASPSRVALFESCPRAHRHRHRDRWPDDAGEPARVGLAAHKALEVLARARIGRGVVPPPGEEELGAAMGEAAALVGSPEELAAARDAVVLAAPLLQRVLLVEHDLRLDVEGVNVGCRLDLVLLGEDGALEAVDWKTGAAPLDPETAELDAQVSICLAALRAFHERVSAERGESPDDRTIRFRLVYLGREDTPQVAATWSRELDAFARARTLAAVRAWQRGHDAPRLGEHCRRCAYRDRCAPYRKRLDRLATVQADPPEVSALPLPELLRERTRCSAAIKLLEGRKSDLDDELRDRLERADRRTVAVGGLRAALRERRTSEYDVAVLPELAAALGQDPYDLLRKVGRVSSTALRRLLAAEDQEGQLAELAKRYQQTRTTDYVEVRETKGVQ